MGKLQDILHDPRLDTYLKLKIYLYILDASRTKEGCKANKIAICTVLDIPYRWGKIAINEMLADKIISVDFSKKTYVLEPLNPSRKKGQNVPQKKGQIVPSESSDKSSQKGQNVPFSLEERTKEDSYPYKLNSSKEVVVAIRGVSGGNNHNDGNGATTTGIPLDSRTENGVTDEERRKMFELLTDAYPQNHIGSRTEAYFEFQLIPHLDAEFPVMMAQIEDLTSRPGKEWNEEDSHFVPFLKDYLDRRYWRTKYQNRTLYPSSSYSIESIRQSIESEKKADSDKTDLSALASDLGL